MTFETRRKLLGMAALVPVLSGLAACQKNEGAAGVSTGSAGQSGASAPGAFRGIDITGANYARSFSLPDATGRVRTLADFKGQVLVVFFGFTQCPDVCPTTMAELAQIKQGLGPQGDKLQAVFITVDPERDTPELLAAYVANFDPAFVALRGDLEQTRAVAREFKVHFAKVTGRDPSSYTIDHTAGAYVFDPQGRVRLFVRHGSGTTALAEDIQKLMTGA